jgi:uncharacterized membrane protein
MSDVTPPPPPPPPPVPPPPGDQPPAYGAPPPGAPQSFDVGAAVSWGWKKFQENLGPILIAMVVYVAILLVVQFVVYFLLAGVLISSPSVDINQTTGEITTTGGSGLFASLAVTALSIAVSTVIFAFLQAAIVRGGLMVADGRRLEVGHMFVFDNFGMIFVAAIIVGAMTAVGAVLCYFPALLVAFFTAFYMFFVVDKKPGAWASIVGSFNLVKDNLGSVFLLLLVVFLLNVLGAIVCLVGLIVSIPVSYLALTYGYRMLQGAPVAP